jgi:hypothetical protein
MPFVTRSVAPILGVFLMAVASGAVRADPTPPATTTAASSSPNRVAPATVVANSDDKVICKTEVPTGTHFGHRVCMRKSDWDFQTQDARHKMDFRPPSVSSGGR